VTLDKDFTDQGCQQQAQRVQELSKLHAHASGLFAIYWNEDKTDEMSYYQRPLLEKIRDVELSDVVTRGAMAEEVSQDIEERTTEPSVGRVPSGGNIDGGNSDVDYDTFWSDGMIAMRSEKNSSDIAFSQFEDQWNQIFMLDAPPDAEIIHEQVDTGYSFVPVFAERYRQQSALDFQQWTWLKDIDHEMERLIHQTTDNDKVMNTLLAEPAEFQMPVVLTYLSGRIPEGASGHPDDVVVLQVDKHSVTKLLDDFMFESSKAQNTVALSDDDMWKFHKLSSFVFPEFVKAAVLAECHRWVDNEIIKRQRRADDNNILTSSCVLIWKLEKDGSRSTSTRVGQRVVVTSAMQAGWTRVSIDISQAFHEGPIFDQVQESRGGERRVVYLRLPPGKPGKETSGSALRRQIKGFESFSDALEVLEMLKSGRGLVDATNQFTIRLISATMDDFKATLDQKDYVNALKPIDWKVFAALRDDAESNELLSACFGTLLGAGAWMDMAVYISALERHREAPLAIHLRWLNRVIRDMQSHPMRIIYNRMPWTVELIEIGDSAYQASDGDSARDSLVMRGFAMACARRSATDKVYSVQLIEYLGGNQNHVCRGVWSAELPNQCDRMDTAAMLNGMFHELRFGCMSAEELEEVSEKGKFALPIHTFIDSDSIYFYLKAQHAKLPADKSTFYPAAHLREMINRGIVSEFTWTNPRDMIVDGRTKGKANGDPIQTSWPNVGKLNTKTETFDGSRTGGLGNWFDF